MFIMLAMLAAAMPIFLAKPLVLVSLLFLIVRIIISKDLYYFIHQKIIITILFIPGILGAVSTSPEHLVRFCGIMLIVLGFPFLSFKIKQFPILVTSVLIIIYLTVTQIFLLHENQLIIDFRDFGYRNEYSYIFDYYGYVENIFTGIVNYFKDGYIRAGGLYFNPNVLAVVLLLYFFLFDISLKNYNKIVDYDKKNLKKFLFIYQYFF